MKTCICANEMSHIQPHCRPVMSWIKAPETSEDLRVMSAPPGLHPPTLRYDTSSRELACPLRRRATSNLREEWIKSKALPEVRGHQLSIMKLPVQMLKRRTERSHICRPKRVTSAADGLLTPRMTIQCNKDFEREWKNEVVKKDVTHRPKFVVHIQLPPQKIREPIKGIQMNPSTMFYRSNTTLTSELQKESKHRHFIMPEWKSEFVDWLRYRHKSTTDFHKYSLL